MQMQPLVSIPSKPTDKQNRPACAAIVQVGQPPAENSRPGTMYEIKGGIETNEKRNESFLDPYAVCGNAADGRMPTGVRRVDETAGYVRTDWNTRSDGRTGPNTAAHRQ